MKTETILITPKIAQELLEKNTMNRKLKPSLIQNYVNQMINGYWMEGTGEAIKIASDGTLLDGQQRLTAIVQSDSCFRFLVISDLDKEVFKVLDTGGKRTAGDIFHISNVPNANNIAGGMKRYVYLKKGWYYNVGDKIKTRLYTSPNELLDIYNENPKLWSNIESNANSWYKKARMLLLTDYIAFYAFLREIDEDDAFTFMDRLANGIMLSENDPIKLLRDKLFNYKTRIGVVTLTGTLKAALIFRAWNHFRKGNKIKILRYSPAVDAFPKPI